MPVVGMCSARRTRRPGSAPLGRSVVSTDFTLQLVITVRAYSSSPDASRTPATRPRSTSTSSTTVEQRVWPPWWAKQRSRASVIAPVPPT